MSSESFPHMGSLMDMPILPPQVVEFALSFKQPEGLAALPELEIHSGVSPEEGQILKSRTVGNEAVRIVLCSYLNANEKSATPYIGTLSSDDQTEVLHAALQSNKPNPALELLSNEDVRQFVTHSKWANRTPGYTAQMKKAYWNSRVGSFPPGTWPAPVIGNHDVMLTQAFGRNSIPDNELLHVRDARSRIGDDDATLDFLNEDGFDPGEANRALASVIAEDLQDPTVLHDHALQWEVADALRKLNPELYATHREALHVLWPQRGVYRTFEVKKDSVDVMDELGLYNALEFAHPDMMVRALGILNKLGVAADIVAADIPFDPNSVQSQVRGKKEWEFREKLTRVEHQLFQRVTFL